MIDVKGKRVYISGPMSDDLDTYHAHDFVDAHIALKKAGAVDIYDPAVAWLQDYDPVRPHEEYMRERFFELTSSNWDAANKAIYDMVVMLPGWQLSEGAKHERLVAGWCGIPCYELKDVVE